MLEEGLEDAIEWVVLELAGGTVLVVPADSVPLSGSADVAIQAQDPCGPLTLRCGVGQWIDGALPPDERTGALAPEALDRARERRRAAAIGAPASAIAHQADADPSLREWLQIVLEAGAALAARRGASAAAEVSDEPGGGRRRPPVRWLALAAAVLLASTLGLLFAWSHERARNVRLGERLSELEAQAAAPLTNLPIVWLLADYRSRDQEIVRVPATAPWLILILSSPAVEIDDSGVRIELQRRDDEQPVWSHAGLRDPGTGEITLAVPRARLASGRYYVLLWHEDRAGPVAVYLLQVVMEAGP